MSQRTARSPARIAVDLWHPDTLHGEEHERDHRGHERDLPEDEHERDGAEPWGQRWGTPTAVGKGGRARRGLPEKGEGRLTLQTGIRRQEVGETVDPWYAWLLVLDGLGLRLGLAALGGGGGRCGGGARAWWARDDALGCLDAVQENGVALMSASSRELFTAQRHREPTTHRPKDNRSAQRRKARDEHRQACPVI